MNCNIPQLPGDTFDLPGTLVDGAYTHSYAHKLLGDLGIGYKSIYLGPDEHAAVQWARSGLMALTGEAEQQPLMCPIPLGSCAEAVLLAMQIIADGPALKAVSGLALLSERAAIAGHLRRGSISPGGSCRILGSLDGHIALNLARDSDWELLPAFFHQNISRDWATVTEHVGLSSTEELLKQGRLLGLAIANAEASSLREVNWFRCAHKGSPAMKQGRVPRVLDLSSLWAGPLCSHLLQLAGASVIKVESTQRPDGARQGAGNFFDLLNRDKQQLTLDLHTDSGQQQLRDLIATADIVIEGSRPRAMKQMGIFAEEIISRFPGLTWISITGYGRGEPESNWIGYGDDVGIAAGLSSIMYEATDEWLICGDAIADPLAGMHAALAAWAVWQSGGGQLIDISLYKTVGHCIAQTRPANGSYRKRHQSWGRYFSKWGGQLAAPSSRSTPEAAGSLDGRTQRAVL